MVAVETATFTTAATGTKATATATAEETIDDENNINIDCSSDFVLRAHR